MSKYISFPKHFSLAASCRGALIVGALCLPVSPASAATLKVSPANPQPGDVLSVAVYPAAGETIDGVGMSAWDTKDVPFFRRGDGTVRAFVGFPFDRTGGRQTLRARVQLTKNGTVVEQVVSTAFTARSRHFPTQNIKMRSSTAGTMNRTDLLRREKLHVQSKMKSSHGAPLWNGSWIVPAKGRPSSQYGRKRYVNGRWWGQHNGSDIKAGSGTPVMATNSGRVVLSEYLPTLRGNCVVIDHGCNIFSLYLHLSRRDVRVGQSVARGQRLGAVGSTGFSTGPHLHWEMRVGWEPVDPYQFVRRGVQF
jgi:murein DD-endopeptidase MepM/ murein hydrolase activator NlpD